MNKPSGKRTNLSRFLRGGIFGILVGVGFLVAHKFSAALDQLPNWLAQAITVALALLVIVFVVAIPLLSRRRVD